jgi:nitrite reductase/ring-hydroxylating ferredoxin subunit
MVKAGRKRLTLSCLEDGSYRAISDTYPHEGASLSNGKVEKMWISDETRKHRPGEKDVVVCPWHNFEFDLETGLSITEPDRLRVKTYEAKAEKDEVIVYV